MKKSKGYLSIVKKALKQTKDELRLPFLVAGAMDVLFVLLLLLLTDYISKRLSALALTLQSVDLGNVLTQSSAQLQAATTTLQGFMYGVFKYASILIISTLIIWFATRWVLWNGYGDKWGKKIWNWEVLGYSWRGTLMLLLSIPFIAYPLLVINNMRTTAPVLLDGTINTSLYFWILIFFLMVFLTLHFSLVNSLEYFRKKTNVWSHVRAVSKKGWTTIHYMAPYYLLVFIAVSILNIALNLAALALQMPSVYRALLLVGMVLILGTIRVYGRAIWAQVQ